MTYPNKSDLCEKLFDHPNETSDDGGMTLEYKDIGGCDGCPFRSECSGPELFGLHLATFELRRLQADLNTMSLLAEYPLRAAGG